MSFLIAAPVFAQLDPAYEPLSKAFEALRVRDYDNAVAFFEAAILLSPKRGDIRKNLAYTLLKTGDSDAARDQFGEAMRLDRSDSHVALEYAFLCFEARDEASAHKAEARRIFARISDTGDAASRETAARAFRNIDEPLAAGIERWKDVLATSPPNFGAHYELAQIAEQRDEADLAAEHYLAAFGLLPERKSVLLDLARVEKARGNGDGAMAALIAASRGGEPRAAELARERMPERYPYVYEFRKALEIDPKNEALHRELAYLLLRMSEKDQAYREDAEREFRLIVAAAPDDHLAAAQLGLLYLSDHRDDSAMPLLKKVLAQGDAPTANRVRMGLHMPLILEDRKPADAVLDPKVLAERSYQSGFFKDALRYYTAAREADPVDASIALRLGWTNNLLHDDATALRWFGIARHSADPKIAAEAQKAWENLRPSFERFRTTFWMYPLYSSRWSDAFGYAQIKTEVRLKKLPFRPYVSTRFVGDARRTTTGGVAPQSLSESAFILGAGVITRPWHGALGWAEAGMAVSYLNGRSWKDYRGGVSWAKTRGASIAAEHGGWFLETLADGVFISHFNDDLIGYSQNRIGYTMLAGGLKAQAFWAGNVTCDLKRQYWANSADVGLVFASIFRVCRRRCRLR